MKVSKPHISLLYNGSKNQSFSGDKPFFSKKYNIVDILQTSPSKFSFIERVERLELSKSLTDKIYRVHSEKEDVQCSKSNHLAENDEKELATEVLLSRHTFTQLVFEERKFRQAALTIIQNIYLFQQRKIFFGTTDQTAEQERQQALYLFSQSPDEATIPLAKSFQHLIIARIWDRIVSTGDTALFQSASFMRLHEVVEQLNTLRNIYMLLTLGLTQKLTRNISSIYRQSITSEDARQIGSFGVARAAYRYHPNSGLRFSTYASNWILKEIQRQALEGRLIRISSNVVEEISRNSKNVQTQEKEGNSAGYDRLCLATAALYPTDILSTFQGEKVGAQPPHDLLEKKEMNSAIQEAIHSILSPKSADILLRRYGIGPYRGKEQSVIEIGKAYGVTRGSIYQLEQAALKKLQTHFATLDS